ncbi:MAG TPA: biopolymer transporter ExbD [Bacteroidia bacterium]|nr:biopolymer transporter ExbD [Bacteroidia bacterium]
MAEIIRQSTSRGKRRRALPGVRVDMTPLVDLGFLLLTFFVLTSELAKENAITASFPASEKTQPVNGMTVFVGKNPEKIFWYSGKCDPSVHLNVTGTKNNGLLNVLKNANAVVFRQVEVIDRQHNLGLLNDESWKTKRAALLSDDAVPFVVVKWSEDASYQDVVNVLDDLNRVHNGKYAVVAETAEDNALINKQ